MTDEKLIEAEIFKIESIHHFHGETCLCGVSSARSRSRTEHITGLVRAVFEKAHAKELDTSTEPVKNGADSLHVTPTDDERTVLMQAVRAGRQARQSWWTNTEAPAEAPSDDEFIVEALASAGFRRSEVLEPQGEPSNVSESASADSSPAQVSVQGEPSAALADAVGGVIHSAYQADRDPYEVARDVLAVVGKVTRRSCTPSADAYRTGGDTLVYAVADWIAAGGVR